MSRPMSKEAKKSMVMSNQLNVIEDDEKWPASYAKAAEAVFATTLEYLKKYQLGNKITFDKPIVVNLSLSNDDVVHELNAQFRGIDRPTNVLSFANVDDENFADEVACAAEVELGDIIIARQTLQKEAEEKHILPEHHFAHLLVHGILHLCGYDHQNDDEAEEMESIEVKILEQLNINNPYEEQ